MRLKALTFLSKLNVSFIVFVGYFSSIYWIEVSCKLVYPIYLISSKEDLKMRDIDLLLYLLVGGDKYIRSLFHYFMTLISSD